MPQFDNQQLEAITKTGTNILVSASAGAGKTSVLVERLVKRCLVDKVSLDEILAMTFTKAAAGEMKTRVAARLQNEYLNANDKDRSWIEEQMILLDSADITTIDSFCEKIIGKYYNVIHLNPAIAKNILDDGKKQNLFKQAFQESLKEYNSEHPNETLIALKYFSSRSENYDEFEKIVNKIITTSETSENPEAWFKHALDNYNSFKSLDDIAKFRDLFFDRILISYNKIEHDLDNMLEVANENEYIAYEIRKSKNSQAKLDKIDKKDESLKTGINKIKATHNLLKNCKEFIDKKSYDSFLTFFETFLKDSDTPSPASDDTYKKYHDSFKDDINTLTDFLYDSKTFKEDNESVYHLAKTILEIASITRKKFIAIKQENACMDFNDMERYAFEILNANDAAVSMLYKAHYKEVMVDEFQDTSLLQNKMVEKLAAPGTLFRVGDVKQSIYRFRQAKPSLMRSLFNDANEYKIILQHNYRSKSNIVDFNNILFNKIMNVEGCLDHYTEDDYVSIGVPSTQQLSSPDPIQLILVNKDTDENPLSNKEMKAIYIAKEILDLHERDGIHFKDFAILVRSHADKRILRKVFNDYDIPYDIDAKEGFFQSYLCQVILSLIKAILDPSNTIALLAVVNSPLYEITDEELAILKIKYGSLQTGLMKEHHEIFNELKELNEIARNDGLSQFLTAISLKNDFYSKITSKDQANFDFLFEKTVQLEKDSHTLYDLLEFMEASEDENSTDAMSRGRDDDVVTVTTIHQSKGLQYSVVFLWGTTSNKENGSDSILIDDDLGIGLNYIDLKHHIVRPTIQRIAIKQKTNLEEIEEHTRLLYVALTRAKDKLYIVDSEEDAAAYESNFDLSILARRKGMTGLISSSLESIPSLFNIKHVYIQNEKISSKVTSTMLVTLPTFTKEVKIYNLPIKPSDHEIKVLPSLSTKQNTYGTSYGTKIHKILSKLPNTIWSMDDLDSYNLSDSDKERLISFSQSNIYQGALEKEIYKEYPFNVYDSKSNAIIYGAIDFIAIGENDITIIDYKTDTTSINTIKEEYTNQLNTYKKAISILYPNKIVSCYIYSLHHKEVIKIE